MARLSGALRVETPLVVSTYKSMGPGTESHAIFPDQQKKKKTVKRNNSLKSMSSSVTINMLTTLDKIKQVKVACRDVRSKIGSVQRMVNKP